MGNVDYTISFDLSDRQTFSQLARLRPDISRPFVLIVEKEATFMQLMERGFSEKYPQGILITGVGQPDFATRALVHLLTHEGFNLQAFALVDADPHGFEIMVVYKYGSLALAHEPNLAAPSLQWLGVLPSDIDKLKLPASSLIRMTEFDLKKTKSMLNRLYMRDNHSWRDEMNKLLLTGSKVCSAHNNVSLSSFRVYFLSHRRKFRFWTRCTRIIC